MRIVFCDVNLNRRKLSLPQVAVGMSVPFVLTSFNTVALCLHELGVCVSAPVDEMMRLQSSAVFTKLRRM